MADDTIYRQAAIKTIENLQDCYNGFSDTYDKACIIGALEEVPSAQPERKMGKWTINDCHAAVYKYHCSECGANHRARYDYCPSCGADMRGEQDDQRIGN